MKVIFVIDPSEYHIYVDATYGYHPNSKDAIGSYSFIHSLIDPTTYYGNLPTTELSTLGLADHNTRSFIGDTRIAGWFLEPESNFANSANNRWWSTYWPFFYNTVHYGGATSSFAATYVAPGFDSGGTSGSSPLCTGDEATRLGPYTTAGKLLNSFYEMKLFFNGIAANERPDLYGFEWYGNYDYIDSPPGYNYTLSCISSDMAYVVGQMITMPPFSIAASKIFTGEGATNQDGAPGLSAFYTGAINETATLGLKGLTVWLSDGNLNTGSGTTGDDTSPNGQQKWALAINSYPSHVDGVRDYYGPTGCPVGHTGCSSPGPGFGGVVWTYPAGGWHWYTTSNSSPNCTYAAAGQSPGWSYYLCTDNFSAGYELLYYSNSTTAGSAVGSTFGIH